VLNSSVRNAKCGVKSFRDFDCLRALQTEVQLHLKHMRSFISTVICFWLISTPVFAEWQRITVEHDKEFEHYVDMQSVKQAGPMSIYRQIQVLSQGSSLKQQSFESTISLHEYDCMNAKLRVLQLAGFSQAWGAGDKVLVSLSAASADAWQALPDTPLGQQMVDLLCPSGKDD